jgi:ABC-type sugar transport system substrate-binding protein
MNARAARSAVALVAAVLALVAGCASASRFESDAGQTAQDGLSAVRTALIGVRAGLDGNLPDAYLVTVLEDAEESLSSTQESFRSMQPPAEGDADQLRAELETLLTRGVDGVAQLRIAAQRGDEQRLAATAADLGTVADALDRFEQEHSS